MAKPSAFAMKMQAKQAAEINYHRKFTTQWCEDAAILAANEVFQRRGDKLVEFRDAYRRWADDIARMTIDDAKGDRSLEYTKDRLDGRLRAVLPEKDFEDWGKRYGGIK